MQQAIAKVQANKHVELDILTAYHVICQTQLLGNDWNVFLDNASNAILNVKFDPCIPLNDLRSYVLHELEMPVRDEDHQTLPDRVSGIFHNAAIYLQRYDIKIDGTKGQVFIYRTPTQSDFDKARSVVVLILELFRHAAGNTANSVNINSEELTITVRGMEKFFDVNIKVGINDRAWVGFDFR